MSLQIQDALTPHALEKDLERMFELSGAKIRSLQSTWKEGEGAPVFTKAGRYTSRGWTEWTQGFQFGAYLLQFEVTQERSFWEDGLRLTHQFMPSHLTHIGVHDHGFNNVSTYGNLLRLALEQQAPLSPAEQHHCRLALKVTGAVQASRWTRLPDGTGYIYSFNGPHSLFVDTLRSLRALAIAHQFGHVLMGERDQRISLLQRLLHHGLTTARHSIYYGEGRDHYDESGRTAHEAIFNLNDGSFRCPNSQQGYSPFSTWTRGQAWAILGYSEQLEFLSSLPPCESNTPLVHQALADFEKAARVTAEHYLAHACTDGIPMWDTAAPGLHRLGHYASQKSNPYNDWEPVDSSAAAIAAQGFLRLGAHLQQKEPATAKRYRQAGLTLAQTLLREPYLSTNAAHQGLLLHSVYHRPNGWDHIPPGQRIPNGESSQWGDYHLRELGVYLWREIQGRTPQRFYF